MENRIAQFIDALTPFEELSYVYPLLVINWINLVAAWVYSPVFFEPSRFDHILAIMYSAAIVMGLVRRVRARKVG